MTDSIWQKDTKFSYRQKFRQPVQNFAQQFKFIYH